MFRQDELADILRRNSADSTPKANSPLFRHCEERATKQSRIKKENKTIFSANPVMRLRICEAVSNPQS
jgi:hypothetical protein